MQWELMNLQGQSVISFMGFMDPAFAPGAAGPAVGGFSMAESQKLLRLCLAGLDIAGMDLVGVSPLYDPAETTCVAARVILRECAAILSYNKNVRKGYIRPGL